MTRHFFGLLTVLISILVLPYWIFIPVLFAAALLLPFFWEGIWLAFLIDVLYGSGIQVLPSLLSPLAFSVLMTLIVLIPLRENLRFHV